MNSWELRLNAEKFVELNSWETCLNVLFFIQFRRSFVTISENSGEIHRFQEHFPKLLEHSLFSLKLLRFLGHFLKLLGAPAKVRRLNGYPDIHISIFFFGIYSPCAINVLKPRYLQTRTTIKKRGTPHVGPRGPHKIERA